MALRFLFFLVMVLGVLGCALAYLARRSMALCPALARHRPLVWAFFANYLATYPLVPVVALALYRVTHMEEMELDQRFRYR